MNTPASKKISGKHLHYNIPISQEKIITALKKLRFIAVKQLKTIRKSDRLKICWSQGTQTSNTDYGKKIN